MSAPLFQQRHYEWLAKFAGETLDSVQRQLLADELEKDNPRFKRERFIAKGNSVAKSYNEAVRASIAARAQP